MLWRKMYFYFYLWDLLQSYKSALESRPFEISYKKKTRFLFALHGYQKNFVCDWEHLALTVLNSLKHLTLTIEAEKFHYGCHFFIYLSDAEGIRTLFVFQQPALKGEKHDRSRILQKVFILEQTRSAWIRTGNWYRNWSVFLKQIDLAQLFCIFSLRHYECRVLCV